MTHHPSTHAASTRRLWTAAAAGALCLGVAAPMAVAQDSGAEMPEKDITFTSAEGEEIGTGTLTGTPAGVLIEVDLQNLPADSWHGFHIHEKGVCDVESGFKSAGGHFNAGDTEHGLLVEGGAHSGDMPNQYVSADGKLIAQVLNTAVSIGGEADVSGRAIVIHGGADDYESQPSGDAGERIACAVIE
ncbi:superoxide dismutase family protein [Roseovarius indicus]|uniref:superoxide dismutase family protein n=1 Tax=Roseovarius indicus TaxID=540747 RepID=UPI0007D959EC|nr:superoxide dismutase family protein [Roseovarius indicus]OAO02822.1 superoxide dismutase [Roseovarius indicus]